MSIIFMIFHLHENTSTRKRKCERKKENKEIDLRSGYIFFLYFSCHLLLFHIHYFPFHRCLSSSPPFSYLSKHAPIPIPQSRRTHPILLSLGLNFPHFLEKLVNGCVEGYSDKFYVNVHNIKSNQIRAITSDESGRERERDFNASH